jgi:V/A-type H+/Na+-transporting ATPase subunit I
MLLPEPMSRILIVGTKDRLPSTIELLYNLENVHMVDFSPDEEGFTLGSPLPEASNASHQLLKLRSMEKDLEVEEEKFTELVPVSKIVSDLDVSVEEIEADIRGTISSKNAKQIRLAEAESKIAMLEPFRSIDLDLSIYRGYDTIEVFSGNVGTNPEPALREALNGQFEMFSNPEGTFVAVFVPISKAEKAQQALVQSGFSEVVVPDGSGKPDQILQTLEEEVASTKKELEEVEQKVHQLREKHANFILASDEHLSIVVEKAELPLRIGETKHSYVMEAWVPTKDIENVKETFTKEFQDNIYIEVLENKSRVEKHEDLGKDDMEAGYMVAETVAVPISEETPVKMNHNKTVSHFTFFTKLLSTPRYNEIDPTIVLAIFFPIFFGLMVGDVGYGIPFTILGFLGLRMTKSKEWRGISTMLFYGGLAAIFFGLFMFGDMFGIEFASLHADEMSWSALLGVEFPKVLFGLGDYLVQLGYYNKLDDVKILLYISLWIGFFHLLLGLLIGFYNIALRHGLKHAIIDKLSWILMFVGFAFLVPLLVDVLVRGEALEFTDIRFIIGIALFLAGIVLAVKGEGGKAIIELPSVISNILSYTRLVAIGMSKAGMALAFNFIALELIAPSGGIMLLVALLVFIVGHLMIFILAIISAGLHSIRLQYVECFTKFFEGGGLDFNPLKIVRKHTLEE